MQETEKYKLKKPSTEDFFNIEDFNENTDKIEQALKENAERVEELKAPSFDDSGTVDGINSFTDFLNSVKNKMNIFQFFKNFKAGMKFILHTGMIVDNYATKEKGFIPDATLVTSLKEQLDEQNTNLGDIKPHAFLEQISEEYLDNIITEKINNAIQKSMIANNLTTTNPEMVLAAPMGKELKRQLDEQNNNKLDKTGGTVTDKLYLQKGFNVVSYNSTIENGGGLSGYVHLAQLKILKNYCDSPIELKISQRCTTVMTTLMILFESIDTHDPNVISFRYSGRYVDAYLNKSDVSTWDLYIKKTGVYDYITVVDINMDMSYQDHRIDITYPGQFVETLPSDTIKATLYNQASTSLVADQSPLLTQVLQRPVDANIEIGKYNGISTMLATSKMTSNKPDSMGSQDGVILNLGWDTDANWGSQIATGISSNPHMAIRGSSPSGWDQKWTHILDENNYASYVTPSAIGAVDANKITDKLDITEDGFVLGGKAGKSLQDQINSIQNPTFDDSGTVEEISNFTDFLNSVKTKMNIFRFFRDFKAGMKYVLHTGRLVNNAVTTEEGFALDARMGKTLQDQITDVNKNLETQEISLQNNWIWSSGSLKMQRVFDCVFLEFEAIYGSITENTTIATIPEGWRPFQWKTTIGASGTTPVIIIIGTDGRIYCDKALPTSDIVINTMWMIK